MKTLKLLCTLCAIIASTMIVNAQAFPFSYRASNTTISYPSGYEIVEEICEGSECQYVCQNMSLDDFAVLNISSIRKESLSTLTSMQVRLASLTGLKAAVGQLDVVYSNLEYGEVEYGMLNTYPCVAQTYKGDLLGTTIMGKIFVFIHNNVTVALVIQATNQEKYDGILAVANTLVVNQPAGVVEEIVEVVEEVLPELVSYDRYGLSMSYPAGLTISEEEYADNELTLSLDNEDDNGGMFVILSEEAEVASLVKLLGLDFLYGLFKEGVMEEISEYGEVTLGETRKVDDNTIMQSFQLTEDDETAYGEICISVRGTKILIVIMMGTTEEELETYRETYNSIEV